MLAESIAIPDNPTIVWVLASAIAIGGTLMALSIRSAFKMAKESSADTSRLVDKVFAAVESVSIRNQEALQALGVTLGASMQRICDTHEKAFDAIGKEIKDFRKDASKRLADIDSHLQQRRERPA